MYIINNKKFYDTLKASGYSSIGDLAKALGIHRNTIHYYLSGHRVFPESIEKIIEALNLRPAEILKKSIQSNEFSFKEIADIIDKLHYEFPNVSFILFGSRARLTNQKYSDWDIGAFSSDGLPHETYRRILRRKDELAENLQYFIDIINLNNADENFLIEISKSWKFLAGRLNDWLEIQRKVAA